MRLPSEWSLFRFFRWIRTRGLQLRRFTTLSMYAAVQRVDERRCDRIDSSTSQRRSCRGHARARQADGTVKVVFCSFIIAKFVFAHFLSRANTAAGPMSAPSVRTLSVEELKCILWISYEFARKIYRFCVFLIAHGRRQTASLRMTTRRTTK